MTFVSMIRNPKLRRIVQVAMIVMLLGCMVVSMVVFADTADDIANGFSAVFANIYQVMLKVLPFVAGAYIIFGVCVFFAGGRDAPDKLRKTFLYSGLAIILVYFAPVLVKSFVDAINGTKAGGTAAWSNIPGLN